MSETGRLVAAHAQRVQHKYVIHYPEHGPRESDPHYADFHAYKKLRKANGTYHCDFAMQHRAGDFSECDLDSPLECHHWVIEFAMMNSVDLSLLEKDYEGVSKMGIGAWVEKAKNLGLLCVNHHRGPMGAHVASYADYGASFYIRNLMSAA